jgi:uncharacterized membrane protein
MTLLKIVLLCQLIGFGVIAGQSFYYLVCFSKVLQELPAREYILMRQTIDRHIGAPFRFVYLFLLVSCVLVIILGARNYWWYAAMLLFLLDLVLALKGNNPINKIIAGWNAEAPPVDWAVYRDRWAKIFVWRQVLAIGSFVLMMVMLVEKANL